MSSRAFERFAGMLAYGVAIGGIAYSVSFVLAVKADSSIGLNLSYVLLLIGGLLGTGVLVAIYQRLRDVEPGIALYALLLGAVGTLGSAIHGGFDLAHELHPVDAPGALALPNAIDPRGLLTFAFTGLGLLLFSRVMRAGGGFPARLPALGTVLGVLLVLIYLGRLIILDPNNPALLGVAAVTGLAVHPIWFLWLGRAFLREPAS